MGADDASQRIFGCLWRVLCDSHGPARWTRLSRTRPQKVCIGHRPASTSLSLFAIMLGLEGRARARMLDVVCPQEGAPQTRFSRNSTNFNVEDETNHDRTVKLVVCRDANHERLMLNEVDIDFRISELPHSVVKQAGNYRVRELVKKIENHPHRQSLQRDLQQSNAYNPFSATAKKMIQDVGNVELFELFETNPKVQCKECLLYWNLGIIYRTYGHLLKESEANRGAIQCTLDLLSIQNYVIKKGRPHGHQCGKTTAPREHYVAHNVRKRCIKRNFERIHDRFLKDPVFRESQLEHDRTEEVWIQMDKDAQKDFIYRMTQDECFRYKKELVDLCQ